MQTSIYKPLHGISINDFSIEPLISQIIDITNQANDIPSHDNIGQQAVYLTFRKHGKRVASAKTFCENWQSGLTALLQPFIERIADNNWYKNVVTSIEVNLLYSPKQLPSSSLIKSLPKNNSRGRKAIIFSSSAKDYWFPPLEMIARNLSFTRALEITLEKEGLSLNEINNKQENLPDSFYAMCFDTAQILLLTTPTPSIVPLFRGNQIVSSKNISLENVTSSAKEMSTWMQQNVHNDGRLTYKYWPSSGKESDAQSMIRQFMGTLCLIRAAKFYNDLELQASAIKNLDYNISNFYQSDNSFSYIIENNEKVKLGACAIAGMCFLEAPNSIKYQPHLEAITNLTKHLQQSDGSFLTFYKPDGRNDCQNFYPGEALCFWVNLWIKTQDQDLLERIYGAFYYYRNWHREQPNPAFIPWHTQAYFALWKETKDDELLKFIFEMNDWLLPVQQWKSAPTADTKGRFYDPKRPFGPPHASATGVYIEGLVDAWSLANNIGDSERSHAYRTAICRALRSIIQLQCINEADMYYISKKKKAFGGVRTTVYDNEIRVDNVQHNLMGIFKAIESGIEISL